MTPEAQRRAIHASLGWKPRYHGVELYAYERADNANDWLYAHEMPDYPNDLNACHEMEKSLTPETRPEYLCRLFDTATYGRAGLYPVDENYLTHHATAAQRSEAFLRTLNLWQP